VVIEANNGGDYLPALLVELDPTVNWRIVPTTPRNRNPAIFRRLLLVSVRVQVSARPRSAVGATCRPTSLRLVALGATSKIRRSRTVPN
jgi:hypothetical protein